MFPRTLLRDPVAGILLAVLLLGLSGAGHAQVAFWQHSRPDGRSLANARAQAGQGGWEMASVRAERQDHVRAQIERMEARARADDRLSGRALPPQEREDERARPSERSAQADPVRGEQRNSGVGPGWQARGRDGGR
ncbi:MULTISPECIES: hypothetical protein [Cupriavidus]|uniref:hypothetical protein n=1 Tax=Cupriavidus TaxID=106589 RepID=UPI00036C5B5E|nr:MULTISPECIES: hypothetical protein [Cupriavidus]